MILHPYLASRKNSQHAIYRGGRDRRRVQKRQTHGKELPQVSEVLAQSIHVFKNFTCYFADNHNFWHLLAGGSSSIMSIIIIQTTDH